MQPDLLKTLANLDGRVVAVAGAGGGGMGTAVTRLIAQAGATVVAVDISQASLDAHVAPMAAEGLSVVPLLADVATEAGVDAVMAAARAAPGTLYGLVTIIGGAPDPTWGPAIGLSRADWRSLMTYNLDSMFFMTQAMAAELVAQGLPGSLVSISSIAGLAAAPMHIGYGAAKAAVQAAVKTMGLELAASGVRVNTIAPGSIGTPVAGGSHDQAQTRWAIPMARRGRSEEIASATLFLLSDMSSYMTGQTIVADGGINLKWSYVDEDNIPAFARNRDGLKARLRGDRSA
jgi:NAD(P)-dependent dehydrogenase (short-subunit alcohol dehydrogenase family)